LRDIPYLSTVKNAKNTLKMISHFEGHQKEKAKILLELLELTERAERQPTSLIRECERHPRTPWIIVEMPRNRDMPERMGISLIREWGWVW
jgi:hypothetical protein